MKTGWELLRRLVWLLAVAILIACQIFISGDDAGKDGGAAPEFVPMAQRLESPRLITHASNDGDSFHIAHAGGSHVFRLYFVDCPEKREYDLVRERLRDQAAYFGGISTAQTLQTGKRAQERTAELLSSGAFTVYTHWERVYQGERFYAFVVLADGEHLAEKLVREGLCRIHTKGARLPDGREVNVYLNQLRAIEADARAAGRGAWEKARARATR